MPKFLSTKIRTSPSAQKVGRTSVAMLSTKASGVQHLLTPTGYTAFQSTLFKRNRWPQCNRSQWFIQNNDVRLNFYAKPNCFDIVKNWWHWFQTGWEFWSGWQLRVWPSTQPGPPPLLAVSQFCEIHCAKSSDATVHALCVGMRRKSPRQNVDI